MNCATCGAVVDPTQDAFCPGCGAPVQATSSQQPTVPMAPAAPHTPGPYPAQGAYPVAGTYQAPAQQPAPGYGPPPAKKGLSPWAIVGIIVGVLVVLALLGTVGTVLYLRFAGDEKPILVEESGSIPPVDATEGATTPDTTEGTDAGTEPGGQFGDEVGGATGSDTDQPAEEDDGIITDGQARETVAAFLDARMAKDVAASRALCTKSFLNGEWKEALNDPTWRPDSYEIVNSTPDLMFVHVVVSERWPSGDEYWIYSVFLDPSTGEPRIDGTLDPQYSPELLPK